MGEVQGAAREVRGLARVALLVPEVGQGAEGRRLRGDVITAAEDLETGLQHRLGLAQPREPEQRTVAVEAGAGAFLQKVSSGWASGNGRDPVSRINRALPC